jgi:hypothetical protein
VVLAQQENKKYDNVNHPSHYTQGAFETIEIIKDKLTPEEFKGYIKGNIIKYITRESLKNGNEDLRKAQWYLNYLIKTLNEGERVKCKKVQKMMFK